jgi:Icc-related predicted phosphoesterase
MKILAFSDFHDDERLLRRARETIQSKSPRTVIIAGDFTNYGGIVKVKEYVAILDFPTIFYVWGNMDGQGPDNKLSNETTNLHLNPQALENFTFIGIGGNRAKISANKNALEALFRSQDQSKLILVSHVPPYGHCDLAYNGSNIGSKELLHLVKKYQPPLVIAGHVHENRTNSLEGSTEIWNVGPRGVFFEITNEKIQAKRIS